jgi:mevalonate kinase
MIEASAPGSLMLLGEHAVLAGGSAVVAAIAHRVRVQLLPRHDQKVIVQSQFGQVETTLTDLTVVPPLTYVLAVIDQLRDRLLQGFELHIDSDMSQAMGLGSSTAVTVAVAAVLLKWLGHEAQKAAIFEAALNVIRQLQGRASGADVAASVFGGVQHYRASDQCCESLPWQQDFHLYYSGKKTKTAVVLAHVAKQFAGREAELASLYQRIDQVTLKAVAALKAGEEPMFYQQVNAAQALMVELGVCDQTLAEMQRYFSTQAQTLACKISGSGLGDCFYTLGAAVDHPPYEEVVVQLGAEGVMFA